MREARLSTHSGLRFIRAESLGSCFRGNDGQENGNMTSTKFNPDYVRHREQTLKRLSGASQAMSESIAREFHKRYPHDAYANHLLAKCLAVGPKKYEAIGFAQNAAQLSNLDPQMASLLAQLYFDFGLHELALPMLRAALAQTPHSALIASDLGDVYSALGRGNEALLMFEAAVNNETYPARQNVYKCSLADILLNLNRSHEAKPILETLLLDNERQDFALFRLATLDKNTMASPIAAAIKNRLEQKLDVKSRTQLLLALGRIYENTKDYASAFAQWQQSRALVDVSYDAAATAKHVTQLTEFYTPELFSATQGMGHGAHAPVFVVGMPRSGTTLVEQILAAHGDVAGVGELSRMSRQNIAFLNIYGGAGGREKLLANAAKGELQTRAQGFLDLAKLAVQKPAQKFVDKTPTQFLAAGYIHLCLPNAKFIHCIRHPADTFISTYQNNLSPDFTFAFKQTSFAHFYLERERLMRHWRTCFGDRIFDLHYEELVADPEAVVRKLLGFLELDWDPNCLTFFEQETTVGTFSKSQVRSAINTKSVGRWKNYEMQLGPLFAALTAANFVYPQV